MAEVAATLGWRSLVLGIGYQPPVPWTFDGRPLRASAVPLLLGWQPVVWTRNRWQLELKLGAVADRITLRREDVTDAATHDFWDVGATAGLAVSVALGRGLRLGLAMSASVYFTGRQLQIEGGPSTRLNILGLQPGLVLAWER